jgi:hypothetical protein
LIKQGVWGVGDGGHLFGISMAAVTATRVQHFVRAQDLIVYIATPAPMQPLAE